MNFDDLAKSARITRKDYLVFLGRWLTKTNAGQKAAKEFSIYAGNEKLIKAGNAFIE
jgi:hypothetical protein